MPSGPKHQIFCVVALSQPNLSTSVRVRVAHKQFVGLTVPTDQVVYSVNSAVWQCPRDAVVDVETLARHSAYGRCQVASPEIPVQANAVQKPVGGLEPVSLVYEGCGQWMPSEYRMCARELLEATGENGLAGSTALVWPVGRLGRRAD